MHNFAHAKVVRNREVGHGVICFREGVETGSLDAEAARGGLLLGASVCCCWADYWGVSREGASGTEREDPILLGISHVVGSWSIIILRCTGRTAIFQRSSRAFRNTQTTNRDLS